MPIRLGAPSRFVDLADQQQRLLMQVAEMQRREAAQRNADMNRAIAGAGENIGGALRTGILTRYRTDQESEHYRDREALRVGLRDWNAVEREAARTGATTNEVIASMRSAEDRRQLASDVRRQAVAEAMKPLEIGPDIQPGIEMLSPTERQEFDRLMMEDRTLLQHSYSDNPMLEPQQIIEGRGRLAMRMEPYLTRARELARQAVTPAQKFGHDTHYVKGEGRYTMGPRGWQLIREEPEAKSGDSGLTPQFDFDGEMQAAVADIQANIPPQQHAGAIAYAQQKIIAKARAHYQQMADIRTVQMPTGDYGYMDEHGKVTPIKSEKAEAERKRLELEAKRQEQRADAVMELMKPYDATGPDGLMQVKKSRTFEEASAIVDKIYGAQETQPAPTAPATSRPAVDATRKEREAALQPRVAALIQQLNGYRGKILTEQQYQERAAVEEELRRLRQVLQQVRGE